MSVRILRAERGLRASLRHLSLAILALSLVACGSPDGSDAPSGATAADPSADGGSSPGGSVAPSVPGPSAGGEVIELARVGGADLEVASYPVEDALAAEGGDAIGAMLESLEVRAADVDLTLAVAPGGDPTISDWRLPDASADAILEAWAASAPGTWSPTTLAGVPALAGEGPDGSSAWAVAMNGRFVYIRTDDQRIAAEVAALVGP